MVFIQLYLLLLSLCWLGWKDLSHHGSYQMPIDPFLSWISWLVPWALFFNLIPRSWWHCSSYERQCG